jgi:hypothetical protein
VHHAIMVSQPSPSQQINDYLDHGPKLILKLIMFVYHSSVQRKLGLELFPISRFSHAIAVFLYEFM